VLTQRKEQGMAYACRSLNPAETNYSFTENIECLPVVWTLEKWQNNITLEKTKCARIWM